MPTQTSNDPSPWFDEPGQDAEPGRWVRWRARIWSAAIVVVVMGIGAWDVVTNGPIHPHV